MSLRDLASTVLCLLHFQIVFGLWPLPNKVELGSSALWLHPEFEVQYRMEQPSGFLKYLQHEWMYV